jgi:hypothetical protein
MPLPAGGIDAYLIAKVHSNLPPLLDRSAFEHQYGGDKRKARELSIVEGVVAAGSLA